MNLCRDNDFRSNEGGLIFSIDSASNDHIVNTDKYFDCFVELKHPVHFKVADQGIMTATKLGHIRFSLQGHDAYFKNVYYAEKAHQNLLSTARINDNGFRIVLESHGAEIIDTCNNNVIMRARREGNCYLLSIRPIISQASVCAINRESQTFLWHRRLGHLNFQDLKKIGDREGLPIKSIASDQLCEYCVYDKQCKKGFDENEKRATRPLQLVHSDVVGPITPVSYDEKSYFVTFLDDYTHFCYVYAIANKSDVYQKCSEYRALVTNRFNCELGALRTDNGGEYVNAKFNDCTKENGIDFQHSLPYRPQQNGRAERLNRSLIERARTALLESGLTPSLPHKIEQILTVVPNHHLLLKLYLGA